MAPKIKIPVRRTGRALAHLHSKPSPHTRLVPRFAGTLRSPQIEMRSAHGWRQPELHFGEARSSLPGIPRTAWRRFAGTLRSPQIKMRFAHGWRQPELHFGEARSSLPGIPRTAWRRFAGTLRSPQIKMRFAHGAIRTSAHLRRASVLRSKTLAEGEFISPEHFNFLKGIQKKKSQPTL